jgi:hypothetical protein
MKQPETQENNPERPPALAEARGSARRRTIKHILNIMQIFLFPICVAIAPGPISKVCMTIATMLFMSRLYIETLKAPNTPSSAAAEPKGDSGHQ